MYIAGPTAAVIVLDPSFKVHRCGGVFELSVVPVKCLKPSAIVIVAVWCLP